MKLRIILPSWTLTEQIDALQQELSEFAFIETINVTDTKRILGRVLEIDLFDVDPDEFFTLLGQATAAAIAQREIKEKSR